MLRMLIENSMFQNFNISRSTEYLRVELCHSTPGVEVRSPETGVIFTKVFLDHQGPVFG